MALEKEFEFFIANQAKLVEEYAGKFIVVKDTQVIGVYTTEIEAYQESLKSNEAGTFLIQQCLPGSGSYTQTFHSRAIF